jgi:hypothetical protein
MMISQLLINSDQANNADLAPPIHGDKVTKPLVGKLVSDDVGHSVPVALSRGLLIE